MALWMSFLYTKKKKKHKTHHHTKCSTFPFAQWLLLLLLLLLVTLLSLYCLVLLCLVLSIRYSAHSESVCASIYSWFVLHFYGLFIAFIIYCCWCYLRCVLPSVFESTYCRRDPRTFISDDCNENWVLIHASVSLANSIVCLFHFFGVPFSRQSFKRANVVTNMQLNKIQPNCVFHQNLSTTIELLICHFKRPPHSSNILIISFLLIQISKVFILNNICSSSFHCR